MSKNIEKQIHSFEDFYYKSCIDFLVDGRKFQNKTQKYIGEKMGISPQQVQKYESGKSKMTLERFIQYSFILERDPKFVISCVDEAIYDFVKEYEGTQNKSKIKKTKK